MIKQMRFEDVVKKLSDKGKFHAFVSNNFRQVTGEAIIKGFTIEPPHIDYYDEHMRTYRYCWIKDPEEWEAYDNFEKPNIKLGEKLLGKNNNKDEYLVTGIRFQENKQHWTKASDSWYSNDMLFRDFTKADGTPIGKLKTNNNKQVDLVFVEGDTFQMDSTDGESDEELFHSVTVSNFHISKYPVTQKQWIDVMGSNPSHFKGDNLPVENISWYDAVDFCNKLSQKEGLTPAYTINGTDVTCNWKAIGYRLPTEAEWEFAAKGGNKSKGFVYAGSDNIDEVAWYESNSGNKTHAVGTKKANELGIYDMAGNVWEWCWDWKAPYSSSAKPNPSGPDSGFYRILRGGSCCFNAERCRSASRGINYPNHSDHNGGFRVVRNG